MGLSSLKSAIGIGLQSARGAPASEANMHYFPVLSGNVTGEQLAQTLPPEVGGALFSRGSYKAGVRGRGDVTMLPRPNTIGYILRSLFNRETVAAATGANSSGLYDHRFYVGDTANHTKRWATLRRYVNSIYGEQIEDATVGQFSLEVAAASIAQAQVQFLGARFSEVAGDDVATADAPVFLTCAATVSQGGLDFIVDRFTFQIGAQLTDNEFRVGSYFLDEITLLQRMVQITADVRIKSRDLFAYVYRNGAVAPTGSAVGDWSPVIYRTDVSLQLNTGEANPEYLKLELPGVDFLTLPVQVAGADLIRAQLTAQVTLAADNFDAENQDSLTLQPIIVTLRNTMAALHDAGI